MPERRTIETDAAPAAVGAYSQAVSAGDLLFCSGQIPLDPSTGEIVKLDASGQARRCLENLSAVCEAAGTSLAAYAEFFEADPPARVAIQAAGLPRGADVEIDAIVAL